MIVLFATGFAIADGASLLQSRLAPWRLSLAIREQSAALLRRGDPRLLADAGLTDIVEPLGCERLRMTAAVYRSHWML